MKTRMKQIGWGIALCIPLTIQAQYSVSGIVNSSSGEAVQQVRISVEGHYTGTYSDEHGSYSIGQLKDGEYLIKTSAFGYEESATRIKIAGNNLEVNITLLFSSLKIEEMQVAAIRAGEKTPTTYSNLSKEQISNSNYGQDLPYLLNTTPSTVVSSDAGSGVGYTGVRIRGVDPTRTNVTINGIPINDSESHSTYWVNMPDFASSTDNIQVQRGVGTSTNGAAAFGASINVKSDNIEKKAYAMLDNSVGSFHTLKTTIKAGTGLINERFTLDARLSRISSDGFIDRASSNLKSLFLAGAWIGKKSILKANVFLGNEKTYQAWNGIPEWKYKGNADSLLAHYYANSYSTADSLNLFNAKNNTYNYYTYENETDNYQQDHYQLHFSHSLNDKVSLTIATHYTFGRGYYEQYRQEDELVNYGLNPVVLGTDTIKTSDIIRRRWLSNHFYGGIFSLNYSNLKNLKLTFGGGINNYNGAHFGEITWARFASHSEIGDTYYNTDAQKLELSAYSKANYQLKKMNYFLDLQVRHIDYSFVGIDESNGQLIELQQDVKYTFFNPKAGLMIDFNERNNAYMSFSIANREPVRGDFVESSANNLPKPEQLQNLEVGYRYKSQKFLANFNYYWMNYKDQLILTGQINDVGGYTRTNVSKSYRSGIELELAYQFLKKLSVSANLNMSQNKIASFVEFVDNYDNYDANGKMIQDRVAHQNTDIAFSPNLIAGAGINYSPINNLDFNLYSKYVAAQYLDNTSSENRKLNGYFTTDFKVNYTIKNVVFSELILGVLVNNVFNEKYVNNGYTFGYISGGMRIIENYYFPQAGRNFMVRLALKF